MQAQDNIARHFSGSALGLHDRALRGAVWKKLERHFAFMSSAFLVSTFSAVDGFQNE